MFCLVDYNNGRYSILDTDDGVIEEYSDTQLQDIMSKYGIKIAGYDEKSKVSKTGIGNNFSIKMQDYKGYMIVAFTVRARGYTSEARVFIYHNNSLGFIKTIEIPQEYATVDLWENYNGCLELTIDYYDKHYYREDRGEGFTRTIVFSKSENGKLSITDNKVFLPSDEGD